MSVTDPDPVLNRAVDMVRRGSPADLSEFDQAAVALYATAPDGTITYYNQACVDFAGRSASVGVDRWCVTWKLFTEDGQALPHDQCPMAVAIKEKRAVRGHAAIAERPDGARLRFVPFPTPVLSDDGRLLGAVNILVQTTPAVTGTELRAQARRWRRLALSVDPQTAHELEALGSELDRQADRLTRPN